MAAEARDRCQCLRGPSTYVRKKRAMSTSKPRNAACDRWQRTTSRHEGAAEIDPPLRQRCDGRPVPRAACRPPAISQDLSLSLSLFSFLPLTYSSCDEYMIII